MTNFNMTQQEIFDTVKKHLLTQTKPAKDVDESCLYRTDDGLKCAVGCLIPDEMYFDQMEHRSVDYLASFLEGYTTHKELVDFLKTNSKLLQRLQEAHDLCILTNRGTFNKAELRRKLKEVAKEFNLRND